MSEAVLTFVYGRKEAFHFLLIMVLFSDSAGRKTKRMSISVISIGDLETHTE